ncbi:unnamed protein product [Dovyalis caffra]|uniref:RING-type E3 ubiquitin transferase n=1 Tax=Dovyalis caffra TaxID=77055 RepID=A0AAV1RBD9_9ROSI|nr:unnamed protein product [Dovyalis caffra]
MLPSFKDILKALVGFKFVLALSVTFVDKRGCSKALATMSFVFRGSRGDIESGFSGFIPERPAVRIHAARPVNSNSLAFLVTVLLLFMILNSHQMSPNFLLWLVVGVFLMATSLRMYATCQQLQAQARAHAAAASGLLGHTELRLHMPPSIAFATRGRLQGLRLQLALLDREFDDLDYDTLRALDSGNASTTSMSEEEINALPVHKYKVPVQEIASTSLQHASSSSAPAETKQDSRNVDGSVKTSEDELTCTICLEQVNRGNLFVACHVCISFIPTASIHGCGNKAHALHGGQDNGENDGSSNGDNVHLHSKNLILVKVWCLIILLVTTFAGGVSPYFYRWNDNFLLLGTQFAGGVFLGTSLMHFLSDSAETFSDLTTKTYPFSFMLACAGYLLTMLGDCIVMFVTKLGDARARVQVEEGRVADEDSDKDVAMDANPIFLKTASLGDTVLLILALCFHSVFEGIAVGVAGTKGEAWRNLWTISLHKIFAAIGMGIALLRMLPKRPFLLTVAYSFAFAVSSPIGVGIGIAIDATTQGQVADWIYAISMGVACGVFIYVAINHLIAKGFQPQSKLYFDTPFFKFVAVLLGVGVIAVVMIWD